MNIVWYASLAITTIAIGVLVFYAIPFRNGIVLKFGTLMRKNLVWLYVPSIVMALFLLREFFSMKDRSSKKNLFANSESGDQYFFQVAELFKSQRNIYILGLGLLSSLGVIVVTLQVTYWGNRNQKLRKE